MCRWLHIPFDVFLGSFLSGIDRKSEDYSSKNLDAIVVGGVHAQCDRDQIALA